MHHTFYITVISILVLLFSLVFYVSMKDKYEYFQVTGRFDYLPSIGTRYICPTRNMSYDIRKNIPIPRKEWHILNSTIGPLDPNICVNNGI
jgi:hypothetical protein